MKLRKEVAELLDAGIITPEVAERINAYYNSKSGTPQSRLLIVFGILGALLVGLGIILILAHNWDDLSRTTKTVFAFLPLVLGQVIAGYALFKQRDSVAWKESSAAFLFIAIGACISLISQIYNIPGEMSSFILTWMLLAAPLIYVMQSSVASLLYIIGITIYGCNAGYWDNAPTEPYLVWVLLLIALPHYYMLYKKKQYSNFFTFHNWFIPLSVITLLGTLADDAMPLMLIAYMSLFGLLYLIGNLPFMRAQKVRNNGYLVLGSLGTVVVLLGLSFDFFWSELREEQFWKNEYITSPEFIAAGILTLAALALLIMQKAKQKPIVVKPVEPVFLLFILIFMIGLTSPMAVVFCNLLVLAIGIMTIREGAQQYHLGILNYGLLIITALVICRFFDTDIPFILKGVLFVMVGLGFFFANYWMVNKRKAATVIPPEIIPPTGQNEIN